MLRFRLRTLLIVVAVVAVPCAWVSYSLKWIEERRALITSGSVSVNPFAQPIDAPSYLWLFGEQGVSQMGGTRDMTEKARRLFPEAEVIEW